MLPKYYEFVCPVKILAGRKALSNLPYEMDQGMAKRPLIITDQGVVDAKLLKKVESVFVDSHCDYGAIFDQTPPDSSYQVVSEIATIFRQNGCDSLVAVGGGSVLDTAKGVNILISEKTDDLSKFQGVDRIVGPMRPFFAIPTTAGTGSEVTSVAIFYHKETGTKMPFMSKKLYPNVAILDPAMTMTMPPKLTAATGMDALTHAIEAYYCLQKNPVSDSFARAAIELIRDNVLKAVEHGNNEDTRMAMANASMLAGIAFSNSLVGIVHALSHACGAMARVPHGIANGILLPFGMEYNREKVPQYLVELAILLEPQGGASQAQRQPIQASQAIRTLTAKLHQLCGLPITLREAGIKEEQLESIAKLSIDDGSVIYNPEEVTYDEALDVLKRAF